MMIEEKIGCRLLQFNVENRKYATLKFTLWWKVKRKMEKERRTGRKKERKSCKRERDALYVSKL